MISNMGLTSNTRGWKPIPACAASGDGQGFAVWGNRQEEEPYVTIDFLLLLLPFSILTGNIPTLAQRTKVTTKDPPRINHPPHDSHTKTTFQRNPPLSLALSPYLRIPRVPRPLGAHGTLGSCGLGRFLLILVHFGLLSWAGLAQRVQG